MRILRIDDAAAVTGDHPAQFRKKSKSGLLPKAVHLGVRAVGWPEDELVAVNRARIAGLSEDAIRELVRRIEEQRANLEPMAA